MSHWKRNMYHKNKISLRICTQTKSINNQETSLCTRPRASLTIEASFIVPLMAGFLAIILFFFRVISVQVVVEEAMVYTGRCVAVESCVVSSEEALFLSAESIFRMLVDENVVVNSYVENKSWGISLLKSEFTGDVIWLRAEYAVKLPVSFFGTDCIYLSSENSFHKWIGSNGLEHVEKWVYITQTGSVYHTSVDCRVLDISIKTAFLSEIGDYRGVDGQKFYPCSRCKKEDCQVVYYTDYGTLYHYDVVCSSLKRTIKKIPLEEVGSRHICSFCNKSEM